MILYKAQKHCYNCDELGHYAVECQFRLWCTLCGESGHCKITCPENKTDKDVRGRNKSNQETKSKEVHSVPVLRNKSASTTKTCFKCGQTGHVVKDCKSEVTNNDRNIKIILLSKSRGLFLGQDCCFNCGQQGHIGRDCRNSTMCKRCARKGHTIKQCPNAREVVTRGENTFKFQKLKKAKNVLPKLEEKGLFVYKNCCFNCGQTGHKVHDCTNEPVCKICGEIGHHRMSCEKNPNRKEMTENKISTGTPKKDQIPSHRQRQTRLLRTTATKNNVINIRKLNKPSSKQQRAFKLLSMARQTTSNIADIRQSRMADRQFQMMKLRQSQMTGFGRPQMTGFAQSQMAGFGQNQMTGTGQSQMGGFGQSQMSGFGQSRMSGFELTQMIPQLNDNRNIEIGQNMNELQQSCKMSHAQMVSPGQSQFQMSNIIRQVTSEVRFGTDVVEKPIRKMTSSDKSYIDKMKRLKRQKERIQNKRKARPNRPTKRELIRMNRRINKRLKAMKKKEYVEQLKQASPFETLEGVGHQLESMVENIDSRFDNSAEMSGRSETFSSLNYESRLEDSFVSPSEGRTSQKFDYEGDDYFHNENSRSEYKQYDEYSESSDFLGYKDHKPWEGDETSDWHHEPFYREHSESPDRGYRRRDREYSYSPIRNYHPRDSISPNQSYANDSGRRSRNYSETSSRDRWYDEKYRECMENKYSREGSRDRKQNEISRRQSDRDYEWKGRREQSPDSNYDVDKYERGRSSDWGREREDRIRTSDFDFNEIDKERRGKRISELDDWKKDLREKERNALYEVERRRLEEALENAQGKLQTCPLPGCEMKFKILKNHVIQKHIPDIFRTVEKSGINQKELADIRISALTALKCAVLGPYGTLYELMDLINGIGIDLPNNVDLISSHSAMAAVCENQNWPVPHSFSLKPMNSPAALIHWRAQVALFGLIDEKRRDRILSAFPPVGSKKIQLAKKHQNIESLIGPTGKKLRKTDSKFNQTASSQKFEKMDRATSSFPRQVSMSHSSAREKNDGRKSTFSKEEFTTRHRERNRSDDSKYGRFSIESSPSRSRNTGDTADSGLLSIEYDHGDKRRNDEAGTRDTENYGSSFSQSNYGLSHDRPMISHVGLSSVGQPFSASNNYSSDYFRQSMAKEQSADLQQVASNANPASEPFSVEMDGHTMNQVLTMLWAAANTQQSMQ